MRRGAVDGPSVRNVCLAALAVRLALFLLPSLRGMSAALEQRPELSTPVGSFRAFKEALHLEWLYTSTDGRLPKPYASGTLYMPPLMLLLERLWRPLANGEGLLDESVLHVVTSIIWSLVDVATGALLAGAYTRKQVLAKRLRSDVSPSAASQQAPNVDGVLYAGSIFASSGGVAACYLFNPFTIASCLARSIGPVNNLAVAFAVNSALAASPLFLAIGWAASVLLSLYPALLVPALLLLCATTANAHERKSRGQMPRPNNLAKLVFYASLSSAALAAGLYLSFVLAQRDWSFVERAYGTILFVPDLTPNIGLWWYFFIEIFDHFRDFFLMAFNVHVASYAMPLTIKYHQDPLFAVTALTGLTATLKSYPTLSDAALFLALVSLHTEILPYLRHPFVTALLYTISALLMPALHHLWLSAGSGNANFFYASTLVWGIGSGAAVLDAMWAWGRWRWELERPPLVVAGDEKLGDAQDAKSGTSTRRVVQM